VEQGKEEKTGGPNCKKVRAGRAGCVKENSIANPVK